MSHYNNESVVQLLGNLLDNSSPEAQPQPRRRLLSNPVLTERLPNSAFIEREASDGAPSAMLRQLRRSPPPHEQDSRQSPDSEHRRQRTKSDASESTLRSPSSPTKIIKYDNKSWKEPQPFEVYRAIERKDIMFLMELRDRAFHLLLRKSGDATPLVHAMRIGNSHRDIAILLIGAFSGWVNHLDDEDFRKPFTKSLLKSLRTNLKLAIDYGLAKSQSDLIASFMQTLVMSEGDKWVRSQISNVSLALRAGTDGKPVETANAAVRKFATRELGKAELIASLEDYVANATVDLVMLAAWSQVTDLVKADPIPVWYFARDDRVYKALQDGWEAHQSSIKTTLSRRLKWQIRVLQAVMEGRNTTYRRKVALLMTELDEGEGV